PFDRFLPVDVWIVRYDFSMNQGASVIIDPDLEVNWPFPALRVADHLQPKDRARSKPDGQPGIWLGKRTIRSRHLPAPPTHLINVSLLFGVWGKMIRSVQFPCSV